jgi:hypothetical protein
MPEPAGHAAGSDGASSHQEPAAAGGAAASVDPEVIAERVYELMRADLRLDLVREGGSTHREG